jgi:hypothetical protein
MSLLQPPLHHQQTSLAVMVMSRPAFSSPVGVFEMPHIDLDISHFSILVILVKKWLLQK